MLCRRLVVDWQDPSAAARSWRDPIRELLPENDIHRARTTPAETSVSLHLLGNDNGCIWRHRFYPEAGRVEPFRSGYVNVPCGAEG